MSFPRTIAEQRYAGRPIDQHTAMVSDVQQHFFRIAGDNFCSSFLFFACFEFCFVSFLQELKTVLLGSSLNCFSVEWRNQGFTFSETHDLRYGIVQKKVY